MLCCAPSHSIKPTSAHKTRCASKVLQLRAMHACAGYLAADEPHAMCRRAQHSAPAHAIRVHHTLLCRVRVGLSAPLPLYAQPDLPPYTQPLAPGAQQVLRDHEATHARPHARMPIHESYARPFLAPPSHVARNQTASRSLLPSLVKRRPAQCQLAEPTWGLRLAGR